MHIMPGVRMSRFLCMRTDTARCACCAGDKTGQYSGMLDCFVKSFRAGGLATFYNGFLPNFARLGSWNCAMFLTVEQVQILRCTSVWIPCHCIRPLLDTYKDGNRATRCRESYSFSLLRDCPGCHGGAGQEAVLHQLMHLRAAHTFVDWVPQQLWCWATVQSASGLAVRLAFTLWSVREQLTHACPHWRHLL